MTQSPVEANFLSGIFSPLTSAEACEKSSWWLLKEKLFNVSLERQVVIFSWPAGDSPRPGGSVVGVSDS